MADRDSPPISTSPWQSSWSRSLDWWPASGCRPISHKANDDFIRRTRVLPLVHVATGMPVDIVLAGPGLEQEFLANARDLSMAGVNVPVISPEDLIVTKILAGRPKDMDDVDGILRGQLPSLDLTAPRRFLALLEEALARDDLHARVQGSRPRARSVIASRTFDAPDQSRVRQSLPGILARLASWLLCVLSYSIASIFDPDTSKLRARVLGGGSRAWALRNRAPLFGPGILCLASHRLPLSPFGKDSRRVLCPGVGVVLVSFWAFWFFLFLGPAGLGCLSGFQGVFTRFGWSFL